MRRSGRRPLIYFYGVLISVPRTSPTLSGHLGIETLKIFMPDHGYDIGYQVIQDRG
jgi:hypothetical protein